MPRVISPSVLATHSRRGRPMDKEKTDWGTFKFAIA